MPRWCKATALKEIYWLGKTYRTGDSIHVTEEDSRILMEANVIGDLQKMKDPQIEMAVKEDPENMARPYRRKARG